MGSPDPSSETQVILDAFPEVCFVGPSRTLPAVYVSAVIDGGSHPFPFRTRKLSLLSPMVLGLRARESRSLQDSRSPLPNGEGLLFFVPFGLNANPLLQPGLTLASTVRQYESLVAHSPLMVNHRGGFFYIDFNIVYTNL